MQKLKNIFLSVLLFLICCSVGIIVGAGIGHGISYLSNEGFLTRWQVLNGSPKFELVEKATSIRVWAQGIDEKLYLWNFDCHSDTNCMQWYEVERIPEDLYEDLTGELTKSDNCQSQFDSPRSLPGKIIECTGGRVCSVETCTLAYYALRDDGTIWAWRHASSMLVDVYISFLSVLLGLGVGVSAFTFLMIRRATKNKKSPTSTV